MVFTSWSTKAVMASFLLLALLKMGGTSIAGLILCLHSLPREKDLWLYNEGITCFITIEVSVSFPYEKALIVGGIIALIWLFRGWLRWGELVDPARFS
ncbi:hypothetical protein [Halobacillus karajensis]|uniref:hypothetical protein n=1 Tax=Halobacillus karajensis TaxID=195088 RepID=UPI00055662AF|nr:hypothetical protein [Halobacillus karajensis]